MKLFVAAMALALAVGSAVVFGSESRAAQSTPPAGGGLQSRAVAYWRLLAAGDRGGASQFFRREHRIQFLENPEPPFQDPEVKDIELSVDGGRATARVGFVLLTPVGSFPWEIRQAWTCVAGEWMAELRRSPGNPFRANSPVEEPLPPADTDCAAHDGEPAESGGTRP